MNSAKDAFVGYTFRADDAPLLNSLRYATVSHTALNVSNLRKFQIKGHCKTLESCRASNCLYRLTSIKNVKLVLWASWRNVINMERTKLLSLVALIFQSSLLTITVRYSRTEHVEGVRYLPSTAVMMSEVIKVIICVLMIAVVARKTLLSQIFMTSNDIIICSLPALLYTIQNNLQFVAVTYLDAATFQVTYQLKILTTALFSVFFLRRHLDIVHWSSLLLLTAGVATVQFPKSNDCSTNAKESCDRSEGQGSEVLSGLIAVLIMCFSSGFAGVYTEKILKSTNSPESLWLRNLQLALCSVFVAAACVYFHDGGAVASSGFFQGYDTITWVIIFQQAILGLIISLVMKFADNILKAFSSAVAIVITTIISSLVLQDLHFSFSFFVGATIVMVAVLLYSMDRSVDFQNSETVI